MAPLTVSNYLGTLQDDPEDEEAFLGLKAALDSGDEQQVGDNPVRHIEVARGRHEQRGELRAVAWLIEAEAPLVHGDPDFEAALWKGSDGSGTRSCSTTAARERPTRRRSSFALATRKCRRPSSASRLAGKNWKQIAARFVEEAEGASENHLKASLLSRAAALVWQYKKRGREKECDRLFRQALEADPSDTRVARLYGETLRQRERWQDMATVLLDAADATRNREDKLSLYVRGARLLAHQVDDRERAAAAYERVLDFAPGHAEALRFLVEWFTEREEWDHLVALYEDALRSRQRLEDEQGMLLQIGMVHWRIRKEPDRAEPYFARLRKIDPAHPGMLDFYREQLGGEEGRDRLLTILADAQRVAGDPRQKLAVAIELAKAAQQGDASLERAVDAWKAVQRLDPSNGEAQSALRSLYRRTEKWNALVEVLKSEIDALPEDAHDERVALLREMIPIYRDRLQLDVMVINTYNAILADEPGDAESLEQLARTYEAMGRWNDLIQVLGRQADAASDPGRKVDLYMRVAKLWIERFANYNQATRPLEQVIEVEPDNREALAQLKEIYTKKRSWKSLFEVLRREAELASDPAARLSLRVELARLAGDRLHRHADAIGLWREVLAQDPRAEGALDALEKLAEREKDWASLAEGLSLRAEQTDDDKACIRVLSKLGSVYGEHLDAPAKAAAAWKRVLDLDPKNGRALRTLRESFLAAGDWDGLEALYAEANDWEGLVDVLGGAAERAEDPELKVALSFRAASIYEDQINEPHRAFRNYERVLSVDPRNVRAAEALIPIYEREEKWPRLRGLVEVLLDAVPADAPDTDRVALLDRLRRLSLERLSDEAGAFGYARRAYGLAPTDADVVAGLEQAAESASAWEQLTEIYKARVEATEDADERLELRRKLAALAGERLGSPDEAIAQLEEILASNPSDSEAVAVLDRLYRQQNRTRDLQRLYLHRIEAAERATDRFTLLGELAALEEEVLEDATSAATRYRSMLEIEPSHHDTLVALDRLATSAERWDELADVLRKRYDVASEDVERVQLMLRLGDVLSRLEEPRAALDAYADVIRLAPGNAQAVAGIEQVSAGQPALASDASRLLEGAYEAQESYEKLAAVLRARLESTEDEDEKRDLRLRLAELAGSEAR